jgi:hypothetical protein
MESGTEKKSPAPEVEIKRGRSALGTGLICRHAHCGSLGVLVWGYRVFASVALLLYRATLL